jgi:hypothetical protein
VFGRHSSHLHVVDSPATRLAQLAQWGTQPFEEELGFWQHILYLWEF